MSNVQRILPASADVAARIRRHRQLRGMSAQHLANALTRRGYPTSRVAIAEIENGRKRTVPVDLMITAAAVFGIPPAALLPGTPVCSACSDVPPPGFTCNHCGTTAKES